MSDLMRRASSAAKRAEKTLRERVVPVPEVDELALAREYDRRRGYDRPRNERSKEARALADGAPVVRWSNLRAQA